MSGTVRKSPDYDHRDFWPDKLENHRSFEAGCLYKYLNILSVSYTKYYVMYKRRNQKSVHPELLYSRGVNL